MNPAEIISVLLIAYLMGSIPTALIVSVRIKNVDIRTIGDGNMGARNTFHQIGPKYGVFVALCDFAKGALPVLLANYLGFNTGWQMVTGIVAISGHDFPIFASFKGGQGTATSLGTMVVLFFVPAAVGLLAYCLIFLIIRNSNISLGAGGAIIALALGILHFWAFCVYAVLVFLFIPVKLAIDTPRRRAIAVRAERSSRI
jgi:acyl phosphate:glycerol-3-phosphate acyltransferase